MLRRFFISILLASFTGICFSADRYQMDIIVFSRVTPKVLSSEYWRSSPSWLEKTKPITLAPAEETTDNLSYPTLTLMPEESMGLKKEASRLEKLKNVVILNRSSWQMTSDELNHPIHIALNGGDFISPSMFQNDLTNTPNVTLSGNLEIRLKRYFNTRFRIILSEPASDVKAYLHEARNCGDDAVCRFYFERTRRTRSKELNYIDTPLLGVVFTINPVDQSGSSPSGQPASSRTE